MRANTVLALPSPRVINLNDRVTIFRLVDPGPPIDLGQQRIHEAASIFGFNTQELVDFFNSGQKVFRFFDPVRSATYKIEIID